MIKFQKVQVNDDEKVLLRNHQDKDDYAKIVYEKSLICVLPHKDGWFVQMVVDDYFEADEWWEKQTGNARIYYGQSGSIRHAK